MPVAARIVVNGVAHDVPVEPDRSLLHVLREELDLTGAKYGCGEGACGACTVLLAGAPVRSCTTPIADVGGRPVTTVEGLAPEGTVHPVARAFLDVDAMQCGYCTTGIVVAAAALLAETPHPDEGQIARALDGNVCRCGVYPRIVRAILAAADHDADPADPAIEPPTPDLPRPRTPWDLTPPDQRDYLEVLPKGLVVALDAGSDEDGSWSTTRDAWVHVGGDGLVTAFVGKVDVGQDNRTALRRIVAAELRVRLDRVRLVMGDTDLCPFDMGTFGSRSMPDAGPVLRAAAAATRKFFTDIAAELMGADPAELVATAGTIRRSGGKGSITYAEIAGREPGVKIVAAGEALGPLDVGPSDGPTHGEVATVTGGRRFASDLTRPGMRHGRILRPPAFGATLRSIDAHDAERLPGVLVVREGGFAGVVASDPLSAGRALDAIRAEWGPEAPQPSDNNLVEHLRSHPVEAHGWEGRFHHETGDVERALTESDVRLDRTYTTSFIAHVPLEARVALAEWEDDRLTVWTATQRPFGVRQELAEALVVPEAHVRVIVPDAGGGYGGKHTGEVAVEAARLARAAGAPVKVRWSREEEFTWAYFRPAAVIDVRSGIRDGVLKAWEFTNINAGTAGIATPYDVANKRIVFQPAESPLRQGSYRALAATANHFARESHMDEIAHELGRDPLELRLQHLPDERLIAVLEAAAELAGWNHGERSPGRALGIACGVEKDAYVATSAEVSVGHDGRLRLHRVVTAFDCGAIVDRDNLINQIEGATVMGLGGALTEAIRFSDGRIREPHLSRYPVPRFTDVPSIDVELIERPEIPPAGAGETPMIAIAPAIANAVFAASGLRLRSLPLAPDGIIDRGTSKR